MTKILRFPADYPVRQWATRLKIQGLLDKLGWDMARCMMGFSADSADKWPLLDDESLLLMVDYLQEEYLLAQRGPCPAAPLETAPARGPALRIAFPLTPEMEARHKAMRAVNPAKPKAARAASPRREDDPQRAAKARYIQRVKMLQRDCETALPHFDDAAYRAILAEQFNGAQSCTALSVPQLRALLLYMQDLLLTCRGQAPASFDAPALLYRDASGLKRTDRMRKIQALLAEKGKAEGAYIRWSYALGILKRQSRGVVGAWEDAAPAQLDAVIAALSRDAGRKGRRTR